MQIQGKRIAILVEDDFEASELLEPLNKMREEGAIVTLIGPRAPATYTDKRGGYQVVSDLAADEAYAGHYDAVIVPGGRAPEKMRLNDDMVHFVKDAYRMHKLIAAICHGAQVLITADLLRGRRVTCWPGIRDDVRNAGADYVDEPVVIDGDLITSRRPEDMPQFNEAILKAMSRVPA